MRLPLSALVLLVSAEAIGAAPFQPAGSKGEEVLRIQQRNEGLYRSLIEI
jgi:hypothetical protein